MLGEACFARPEARSCVGHAFAEAIFDQQIAPQQAEIAGYVIAEPFESGGNLFVQSPRVVAIGKLGQELGSLRPEKPHPRVIPRLLGVAVTELRACTRMFWIGKEAW